MGAGESTTAGAPAFDDPDAPQQQQQLTRAARLMRPSMRLKSPATTEIPAETELGGVNVLHGHLYALRKFARRWDRAYFVLVSSSLFMYRDVEAYKNDAVEEECNLAEASVHLVRGEVKPLFAEARGHCFRVHSQGKQILLSSDRAEISTIWSEALRRSCSKASHEASNNRFGVEGVIGPDATRAATPQAAVHLHKQASRRFSPTPVHHGSPSPRSGSGEQVGSSEELHHQDGERL